MVLQPEKAGKALGEVSLHLRVHSLSQLGISVLINKDMVSPPSLSLLQNDPILRGQQTFLEHFHSLLWHKIQLELQGTWCYGLN